MDSLFIAKALIYKTLFNTFVTTFGVKPGVSANIVDQQVTLDDLFAR